MPGPQGAGSGLFGDDILMEMELARMGIMPGEQAGIPAPVSKAGSPQSPGLGGLFNDPLFMLGANMLSNSGPSLQPQSFGSNAGRAALQTQQQLMRQQMLESELGLNKARAAAYGSQGGNPTAGNVQSTFKGANGNIHIISRDGTVRDTGIAFNNNVELVEQKDGSVIAIDRSTGTSLGSVVSPDQAAQATKRAAQTEAQTKLPTELAGIDTQLSKIDKTVGKINEALPLVKGSTVGIESRIRGDLPGFLGGDARTLKQAVKSLQAEFGFDTLAQMRAASKSGGALGQVSERELDLLINAMENIDLEGDPDVLRNNLQKIVTHYNNYKSALQNMRNAILEQAGQPPQENVVNFEDL